MITEWNRGLGEEITYDPTTWTDKIDQWRTTKLTTHHKLLSLQRRVNLAIERTFRKYAGDQIGVVSRSDYL